MTKIVVIVGVVLATGAPLFISMLAAAALGSYVSMRGFELGFDGAIGKMFGLVFRDEMTVWSTLPPLVYAGYLLSEARMGERLSRVANALLGWLPGGVALATATAVVGFIWLTGSSVFTLIVLGSVFLPSVVKHGFAVLDFTPSRFPRRRFELGELVKSLAVALPELVIPFGMLAGMAGGLDLSEVAALTVVYVFVLEVGALRRVQLATCWRISTPALALTGAGFALILAREALVEVMVNATAAR